MDLSEVQKLANETLQKVRPLVGSASKDANNLFETILLGTLRRDYSTLYTIAYLSKGDVESRKVFADSCADLVRRVFEDLISLEYIKLKDKGKYSKQFTDFEFVESYRDLEYLKASGNSIDPLAEEKVLKNYEMWLRKSNKKDQKKEKWTGACIEEMMSQLHKAKVINEKEFLHMSQIYIQGNYRNHFSPAGISSFLSDDSLQAKSNGDTLFNLVFAASSVAKIAILLLEERGENSQEALELWNKWK